MGRQSSKQPTGTYLVTPEGMQIRVHLDKIKSDEITGRKPLRQGMKLIDEKTGKEYFKPVFNATMPLFREDAPLKLLQNLGIEINENLARHLGLVSYCIRCGRILGSGEQFLMDDGEMLCAEHSAEAKVKQWVEIPRDKRFKLAEPEAPEVLKQLFAEAPIKKFYGLANALLTQLTQIPLDKTSRAKIDAESKIIPDTDWKNWMVKETSGTGEEILDEFPYLEKTHLLPVVEAGEFRNVHPAIYWDQFETLERGGLYELSAYEDAGRFAMWNLAHRYMSGDYTFPDGSKGEAMVVVDGYHAIGGTTQEYIALLAPKQFIDVQGKDKFLWLLKTAQARVQYTNAMDVPMEGERPRTVGPQKAVVMQSFEQMLQGLIKT